ncbi:hypothetical protein B0I35DRAFT_483578 [Stachybotrys elegans]|uniref:Uncharacterized protein n=1 Tax=Stachybotrys elegans TaxID=80388 RepID=A0A8K0SH48_9HYPO|nr:hypothetical protein B0I35DRAFT_483578 [Stachybotrys elegans]
MDHDDLMLSRSVLFDHPCYYYDHYEMVRRVTNGRFRSDQELVHAAAQPGDNYKEMPTLLDAWKWVVCDVRSVDENTAMQALYEKQLEEERLQTPQERARELIRSEGMKMARRNARWVIPVLEKLSPQELAQMEQEKGGSMFAIWTGGAMLEIWKQVSPPSPPWIQHIADSQQPWGFVFYKSRLVQKRYGHRWDVVWDDIAQNQPTGFGGRYKYSFLGSIHCRGSLSTLKKLWTEVWAPPVSSDDRTGDDGLRDHFEDYKDSIKSPGILRNTFIVIDAQPIPRDLWRQETGFDMFWVWAYDPEWRSLSKDTILRDDEYQGRVKVSFHSLNAWFYAACLEGISIRDMWLKAQQHPDKIWIGYSKFMEPWDHAPYV